MPKRTMFAGLATIPMLLAAVGTPALSSRSEPALFASLECSFICSTGCAINGGLGHEIISATGGFLGGFYHDDCAAGNSCEAHSCGGGSFQPSASPAPTIVLAEARELLADEAQAAAKGDVDAALALLSDFGPIAKYSSERQAIQIQGCNPGAIAIHIPLTAAQLEAIGE